VWQDAIAWVGKEREDGPILLVSEEPTGQDGLDVEEGDTVQVGF
jgi:hypothetical protein